MMIASSALCATSARRWLDIYRRRADHVDAIGLEHGGFDEALAYLEACEAEEVRTGRVTDGVGQRHSVLFVPG